jgi:hypothetical protein
MHRNRRVEKVLRSSADQIESLVSISKRNVTIIGRPGGVKQAQGGDSNGCGMRDSLKFCQDNCRKSFYFNA